MEKRKDRKWGRKSESEKRMRQKKLVGKEQFLP